MAGSLRRSLSEFPDGGAPPQAHNFQRSTSEFEDAAVNDEVNGAEAALKEQFRVDVLKLRFSDLPKSKLVRLLDQDSQSVIDLGLQLGFSKAATDDMIDKQFGGGKPHAHFVDVLHSRNFSIEHAKEAMINAGVNTVEVNKLFSVAERKRYEYFSEFQPNESAPFQRLLREDPYNRDQPCWKHVAEELGMDDVIPSISATRLQGGQYSIGDAFCRVIMGKNLTIKAFKEDLENQLSRMQEDCEDDERIAVMQNIIDTFKEAIEDKVKTMMRVHKEKEKRNLKEKEKRNLRRQFSNFS